MIGTGGQTSRWGATPATIWCESPADLVVTMTLGNAPQPVKPLDS